MPTLRRIAREPLLHFLLLGGAVLAAYSLVSDPPAPPPREEIVVTQDEARQFANRFGAVWGRPPRPEELDALIDEYVREEVLVREALKLSMDRDDAVIRQRLAQKMRFLIESAAGSAAPSEDELREHFQANADDYERGARIAFEQVFLGESPSAAEVEAAREALLSGTAPGEVGQRILLPQAMPLTGARPVDGSFGEGFFQRLEQAEAGVWAGPVRSGYGAHLVRVTAREPAGPRDFADVRDEVAADWRRERTAELADAQYQRLTDDYTIRRPDAEDLAGIMP